MRSEDERRNLEGKVKTFLEDKEETEKEIYKIIKKLPGF